ncbi:hypothetical protein HYPSUDRAFT_207981 [Hypholoma sublateritium FD-334 SS-4]|uniref:Uncharacterized protein n=1 Tax=Hypholoma sublateritium (strain FD-334 SS-4) TaxID=945553 RepID=A0A0D2P4C0_HYPSF|nr:hypothetical protein HYPSUDRAFT_207981 [Hypholoma sublateritium FD-334 SS-4]
MRQIHFLPSDYFRSAPRRCTPHPHRLASSNRTHAGCLLHRAQRPAVSLGVVYAGACMRRWYTPLYSCVIHIPPNRTTQVLCPARSLPPPTSWCNRLCTYAGPDSMPTPRPRAPRTCIPVHPSPASVLGALCALSSPLIWPSSPRTSPPAQMRPPSGRELARCQPPCAPHTDCVVWSASLERMCTQWDFVYRRAVSSFVVHAPSPPRAFGNMAGPPAFSRPPRTAQAARL